MGCILKYICGLNVNYARLWINMAENINLTKASVHVSRIQHNPIQWFMDYKENSIYSLLSTLSYCGCM
jgi:hypothetical protein